MFTCADCKEIDCVQAGSDQNACDSFNGEEPVSTVDVYGDEVYTLKDAQDEIESLTSYCIGQHDRIVELERKFNTIIAAVVKASGPEEER